MNDKRIVELENQNRELKIRLRALEYAFMLSVVDMTPDGCRQISDGFGHLQSDILKSMTDAEARENAAVTKQLKFLLRHVFIQGSTPSQ